MKHGDRRGEAVPSSAFRRKQLQTNSGQAKENNGRSLFKIGSNMMNRAGAGRVPN